MKAHMWFDNTIIEADTTEDQSGVAHDKVCTFDLSIILFLLLCLRMITLIIYSLQFRSLQHYHAISLSLGVEIG